MLSTPTACEKELQGNDGAIANDLPPYTIVPSVFDIQRQVAPALVGVRHACVDERPTPREAVLHAVLNGHLRGCNHKQSVRKMPS